jgi:catechol 2,3-dioxygenase-like lactoylglutathione lyase family enzyme
MRLHHVQLAIPAGSEPKCRQFYGEALGWREIDKPDSLKARGGVWFAVGECEVHLGVEQDFRPARKAHPALAVANLDELAARLRADGAPVEFDDAIAGVRRLYTADPVGNRIELIEETERPTARA